MPDELRIVHSRPRHNLSAQQAPETLQHETKEETEIKLANEPLWVNDQAPFKSLKKQTKLTDFQKSEEMESSQETPSLFGSNSPKIKPRWGEGAGLMLCFPLPKYIYFFNFPIAPGLYIFQNIKHEQTRSTQYAFVGQVTDVKMLMFK